MKRRVYICLLLFVFVFAGAAQARICQGLGDANGLYGYVATRSLATGTSTASTTPAAAGAPVSALIASTSAQAAFGQTGMLYFDGAGVVKASATPGFPNTNVGTYTVNADCSIAVNLSDVFANINAVPGAPLVSAGTAQYTGLITFGGSEIVLSSSTASMTLKRAVQVYACGNSLLVGTYALTFSGVDTGGAAPATAFSMWRIVADGAGNLVADPAGQTSGVPQGLGTYTVNADCTGTAALTVTAKSGKATTTNINFVLVLDPGSNIAASRTPARTELDFVIASPTLAGPGIGVQQ